MDSLIVATVQQQMQIAGSHAEYREDLRRFLKVAVAKRAHLVIFPELGGLVVMPPLLGDVRSALIKRAEWGRRKRAGLWDKVSGHAANFLADWFKADLRAALAGLLDVAREDVWSAYCETFGGLAREFGVTLVAPSGYLPDPSDGVIRNLAAVFDEHGELLGTQAKVVLHAEDTGLAQAGSTWDIIPTDVGRLGLILGADVLFPEVGRLLAYRGADMLAVQGACLDATLYNKIRTGVLARMQDNQLFAAAGFLVGPNRWSRATRTPYAGKSAIFAPQELTPRKSGVLVEMTSRQSEGVLTAVWDFVALRELWESSDTPVRRQLPLDQAGHELGQLYSRLEHLPRLLAPDILADAPGEADSDEDFMSPHDDAIAIETVSGGSVTRSTAQSLLTLDELEVRSSITSRWPLDDAPVPTDLDDLGSLDLDDADPAPADLPDMHSLIEPTEAADPSDAEKRENAAPTDAQEQDSGGSGEDETDEMDALPRRHSG